MYVCISKSYILFYFFIWVCKHEGANLFMKFFVFDAISDLEKSSKGSVRNLHRGYILTHFLSLAHISMYVRITYVFYPT